MQFSPIVQQRIDAWNEASLDFAPLLRGEREVMLSDAMRLAAHLAENRVRVSLEVWPDMFHVWHLFAADLPEGMRALEGAAAFLEESLNAGADPL